jgi:hypothetical protein
MVSLDCNHFPEVKEKPIEFKDDSQNKSTSTDFIADFLGPIGKWQIRTIFLVYLTKIPASFFMACIIFTAPTPQAGEIYCKPPVPDNTEVLAHEWIKIAHPIKALRADQEIIIDFCNVQKDAFEHVTKYLNRTNNFNNTYSDFNIFNVSNDGTDNLVPCSTFEEETVYNSIITQFDLYCSRDILVAVTQFCHLFGVLCGGIVTHYMLKVIEPRRVMMIGFITQIVCGNLTGWINIFELHIFFRCLSATCCGLQYTAGGVICEFYSNNLIGKKKS